MTLLWNWRAAPEWNHFPLMLQDAGTYPGLSRLMKLNWAQVRAILGRPAGRGVVGRGEGSWRCSSSVGVDHLSAPDRFS